MNSITTALKTAGVKLPPLNKRVWLWLHDHPDKTSKDVALAIKTPHSDVATVMTDMLRRKMVTRTHMLVMARQGSPARVFVWRTCLREFELLPLPPMQSLRYAEPKPIFDSLSSHCPAPAPTKAIDVDALTLREARALYLKLKDYFAPLVNGGAL
jgi:hypothetical protein